MQRHQRSFRLPPAARGIGPWAGARVRTVVEAMAVASSATLAAVVLVGHRSDGLVTVGVVHLPTRINKRPAAS
jgi:hypothetical protein